MALPKSCMTLLLWIMTIMTCCLTTTSASRFLFTLPSAEEECFMEEVDSRSSANQLLFRFGIIDPESYDFVDVTIKTPQLIDVKAWNKTQANYGTSIVRESGLYRLCFKKHAKSSNNLQMYYSFDFISSGTINVVMYANVAATLNSDPASSTDYTAIELVTKEGKATKMGLVDFPLSGASSSLMTTNTRVLLIVSVENVSKEKVDISIAQYPHKLEYPISWQSFGEYATHEYKKEIVDTAEAVLGDHIGFDVTEIFGDALRDKKTGLTFTLHAHEDAEATLTGTMANGIDYYPQLIVEDMGLDLMREITYFKERVFSLRGEITYIKSKERRSRAAAESANSRVMWLSLFTNLVLMWIAMAQVLYIRKMLESSY